MVGKPAQWRNARAFDQTTQSPQGASLDKENNDTPHPSASSYERELYLHFTGPQQIVGPETMVGGRKGAE